MKEGISKFQVVIAIWVVLLTILSISNLALIWEDLTSEPPVAIIKADPVKVLARSIHISPSGSLGWSDLSATVEFSAADSFDRDGDPITFNWDFTGEKRVDSNIINPTFSFPYQPTTTYVAPMSPPYDEIQNGTFKTYVVTLTVTDCHGKSGTDAINIHLTQKVTRE